MRTIVAVLMVVVFAGCSDNSRMLKAELDKERGYTEQLRAELSQIQAELSQLKAEYAARETELMTQIATLEHILSDSSNSLDEARSKLQAFDVARSNAVAKAKAARGYIKPLPPNPTPPQASKAVGALEITVIGVSCRQVIVGTSQQRNEYAYEVSWHVNVPVTVTCGAISTRSPAGMGSLRIQDKPDSVVFTANGMKTKTVNL